MLGGSENKWLGASAALAALRLPAGVRRDARGEGAGPRSNDCQPAAVGLRQWGAAHMSRPWRRSTPATSQSRDWSKSSSKSDSA